MALSSKGTRHQSWFTDPTARLRGMGGSIWCSGSRNAAFTFPATLRARELRLPHCVLGTARSLARSREHRHHAARPAGCRPLTHPRGYSRSFQSLGHCNCKLVVPGLALMGAGTAKIQPLLSLGYDVGSRPRRCCPRPLNEVAIFARALQPLKIL
jgi:hypothetical protein